MLLKLSKRTDTLDVGSWRWVRRELTKHWRNILDSINDFSNFLLCCGVLANIGKGWSSVSWLLAPMYLLKILLVGRNVLPDKIV